MKRLFFTSLALFLLVIIFLLAYNFAFKTNINDATIGDGTETTKDSDSENFGKESSTEVASSVENPINEDILGAAVGPDANIYYYSFDDAVFKKATLEGKDKTTLLSNLPGKPIRIVWSARKDNALILIEGTPKPRWYSASFATKTLTPLKEEIVRATWNNLGDKIYYLFSTIPPKIFLLIRAILMAAAGKSSLILVSVICTCLLYRKATVFHFGPSQMLLKKVLSKELMAREGLALKFLLAVMEMTIFGLQMEKRLL